MTTLELLGWDPGYAASFEAYAREGLLPGRVTVAHNHLFRVAAADGEGPAVLAGRVRHLAEAASDLPVAGDWVALSAPPGDACTIRGRLERRSFVARLSAGGVSETQVVAANVDTLFVVAGLDGDFSPRRVERYLELALAGGSEPVIVLNKADLCEDAGSRLAEMERVALAVPVAIVSAALGSGLEQLAPYLGPGRTVALVGSSGVGKSTLVNRLLGEERQLTRAVREGDDRGRHTTTRRELLALPGGGALLDTPGLREVGLSGGESLGSFADVEALAEACGFRDCTHTGEPRCAVKRAVEHGELPADRLDSYHKLRTEQRYASLRQDEQAQSVQRRKWRAIHRAARRHKPRE
jgi:ribosome biogenesis GTPase